MTSMKIEPTPVNTGGGSDDDNLEHYYCACDPDISLCGTDLSGIEDLPESEWRDDELCIVCFDLRFKKCERCGA